MSHTTGDLRIRISTEQKEILLNVAKAKGFSTISAYVRSKVFDDDLSVHEKLNRILRRLECDK